jgi:hypothetical protein
MAALISDLTALEEEAAESAVATLDAMIQEDGQPALKEPGQFVK